MGDEVHLSIRQDHGAGRRGGAGRFRAPLNWQKAGGTARYFFSDTAQF